VNPHTLATAPARAAQHIAASPAQLIVLLIVAATVSGLAYAISLRLHPWRPCQRCGESGKHRGTVFTRSFRPCGRCGGTGRELRRFARPPY
jgi:hypothetical protein